MSKISNEYFQRTRVATTSTQYDQCDYVDDIREIINFEDCTIKMDQLPFKVSLTTGIEPLLKWRLNVPYIRGREIPLAQVKF